MSHYAGLQIHSSNDIILTSALGKNITLNGKVYNGTGVGLRIVAVQDQLRPPRYIYSTENVEFRTDLGKKVVINGTQYVSTTGIARTINPSTRYTKDGVNWYFLGDFTIEVAPGKKIICNDIEITPIPDVPSTATVTSCSPNTLMVSSGTSVTVNGTGFTPATVIQASNSPVQTTYVSATALTTTYLGTVSSIQTIAIGVRKPGELISNTVNFSVTAFVLAPNYVVPANSGYEGYVIFPGDNAGVGNTSLPGLVYLPGAGMRVDDVYDNPNDNGLHEMLHDIVYALRQPMYCHYKATGDWGNQACIDYFEAHYPTVIGTQMGNNPNQLLLIGASAGGAIAVNFISQNPGKTYKYVGLAPVSDLTDIVNNNRGGHAAGINSYYQPGGWSEATYGATYNPTTVAGSGLVSGFHCQVWYGDVDNVCVKPTVETIVDQIPGATKVMIVGGDHGSWITPALAPEIVTFIQSSYTPLVPSTSTITSCSPSTLVANSSTTVTVNGTGFTASTTVQVNGITVQTTYISTTSVTTTYLGAITTAKTVKVTVENPNQLPSNSVNFIITAPALPVPNITNLSPSSLQVNSGTLVTINGTNFVFGCVVKANGIGVQTTFISATQLTTTYLGTVSSVSTVAVTVQNPDTQTSNSINFSVTAFVPIPDTGLTGWFDASDASTFTYSSGSVVSQWRDKSGQVHHANQSIVAQQPTRNITINGTTAVRFLSTNQFLEIVNFASAYTEAEIFVVLDLNTIPENGAPFGAWGVSTENSHYTYSDGNVYEPWGTTVRKAMGNPVPDLTSPHIYNIRTAPSSYVAEINGEPFFSTATNTVGFRNSFYYQVSNGGLDGAIGEIIFYNRVLSGSERGEIETYLSTRWGVQLGPSLPVTSGLVLWLDAADASSFTLTGSHVEQWRDKSTTALVYVPSQPAKGASRDHTQNGKSTVYFDGTTLTGGMLETPVWSAAPLNNFTRITVSHTYKPPPTASRNYMQDSAMALSHFNAQGQYGGLIPGVAWISVGAETSGSWQIQTLTCNAGTGQFRKDGVNYGSSTGISLGSAANGNYLGGEGWTVFTRCEIAEVIYYNRVLTAQELTDIEGYLKAKWGTP